MADDGHIPASVKDNAAAAAKPIHDAGKSGDAPVFNLAKEATELAHHRPSTMTEGQNKEYEHLMDLYNKSGDRMGSPTWNGADPRNTAAFKAELDKIEKMPEADRTAILGRAMYHAGHEGEMSGSGLLADIMLHAPSSKKILFTDTKGKNVPFSEILKEGLNVNTSGVNSTAHDIEPSDTMWKNSEQLAAKAHQLEVRDQKASHQK